MSVSDLKTLEGAFRNITISLLDYIRIVRKQVENKNLADFLQFVGSAKLIKYGTGKNYPYILLRTDGTFTMALKDDFAEKDVENVINRPYTMYIQSLIISNIVDSWGTMDRKSDGTVSTRLDQSYIRQIVKLEQMKLPEYTPQSITIHYFHPAKYEETDPITTGPFRTRTMTKTGVTINIRSIMVSKHAILLIAFYCKLMSSTHINNPILIGSLYNNYISTLLNNQQLDLIDRFPDNYGLIYANHLHSIPKIPTLGLLKSLLLQTFHYLDSMYYHCRYIHGDISWQTLRVLINNDYSSLQLIYITHGLGKSNRTRKFIIPANLHGSLVVNLLPSTTTECFLPFPLTTDNKMNAISTSIKSFYDYTRVETRRDGQIFITNQGDINADDQIFTSTNNKDRQEQHCHDTIAALVILLSLYDSSNDTKAQKDFFTKLVSIVFSASYYEQVNARMQQISSKIKNRTFYKGMPVDTVEKFIRNSGSGTTLMKILLSTTSELYGALVGFYVKEVEKHKPTDDLRKTRQYDIIKEFNICNKLRLFKLVKTANGIPMVAREFLSSKLLFGEFTSATLGPKGQEMSKFDPKDNIIEYVTHKNKLYQTGDVLYGKEVCPQ